MLPIIIKITRMIKDKITSIQKSIYQMYPLHFLYLLALSLLYIIVNIQQESEKKQDITILNWR